MFGIGLPEIVVLLVWLIYLFVYIIPTLVAYRRKLPNKKRILLLNILAGWTVVGWIVSMVLALKKTPSK